MGDGESILNMVVREGLMKMSFMQKHLRGDEGMNSMDV
jgi:hypothetical protein